MINRRDWFSGQGEMLCRLRNQHYRMVFPQPVSQFEPVGRVAGKYDLADVCKEIRPQRRNGLRYAADFLFFVEVAPCFPNSPCMNACSKPWLR